MKTIPLKQHATIKIKDANDKEAPLSTLDLIRSATNNMPTNNAGEHVGISVEDMVIRLKIRKVLDDLNPESTVLELEDADWNHLKDKLLPTMRWTVVDEFIPDFVNSIKNA